MYFLDRLLMKITEKLLQLKTFLKNLPSVNRCHVRAYKKLKVIVVLRQALQLFDSISW